MTDRQRAIRNDLEAWEDFINYRYKKDRGAIPNYAEEQRSILLKLLLKVQTEEYDRS